MGSRWASRRFGCWWWSRNNHVQTVSRKVLLVLTVTSCCPANALVSATFVSVEGKPFQSVVVITEAGTGLLRILTSFVEVLAFHSFQTIAAGVVLDLPVTDRPIVRLDSIHVGVPFRLGLVPLTGRSFTAFVPRIPITKTILAVLVVAQALVSRKGEDGLPFGLAERGTLGLITPRPMPRKGAGAVLLFPDTERTNKAAVAMVRRMDSFRVNRLQQILPLRQSGVKLFGGELNLLVGKYQRSDKRADKEKERSELHGAS